jgi:protein translocase SecG subunit
MATAIPFALALVSVLLIGAILLQTSAAGIGALGGADSVDAGFHTRRGPERVVFVATVVLAVAFAVLAFAAFRLA